MAYYITILSLLLGIVFSTNCVNDDSFNHIVFRNRRSVDTVSDLQNVLQNAKQDDGIVNPNILLKQHIQDPIVVPDFNVSSNGAFTDVNGQFANVSLHGMKGLEIRKMQINLAKMNLSAVTNIPILSLVGDYNLDGSVTFFSVSGNGGFWMNLTDINLYGYSILNGTDDGRVEVGKVILQSEVEDIKLHFENLMGGGRWSSLTNSLLNQLSELILDEVKQPLLRDLSNLLRKQLNYILFEYLPEGFMDPETSNIVDSVLMQAADVMSSSGIDPLPLPDHEERFERQLLFITTHGELTLSGGQLHGLSTLYRTGDVLAVYENNSVSLEANLGYKNLTGNYEWEARVFGVGPSGSSSIAIKSVEGFIRLRQEMRSGSKLELDTFEITNIRHIWVDIGGLQKWDFILETVVNLVTNGLKMTLADIITPPVKKSIQKELDFFNITIS